MSRREVSVSSPSMQRILRALQQTDEQLDAREIAKRAFVSFNTFENYKYMLMDAGLIFIAGWRHRKSGSPAPLFRAGCGETAPRPEKLDQLARARNWKQRTGYHDAEKAKRRLEKINQCGLMVYLATTPTN